MDSNAKAIQSDDLAVAKARLEIEKLSGEISAQKDARSWPLLRGIKITDLVTPILALVALTTAWRTGLFDAKILQQQALRERLETEKFRMEDQQTKARSELDATKQEIAQLKGKLSQFELEEAAESELKQLGQTKPARAKYVIHDTLDDLEIDLHSAPPVRIAGSQPVVEPPDADEFITVALRHKRLKRLRLSGLQLSKAAGEKIGRNPRLWALFVENCAISPEFLGAVGMSDSIKWIRLSGHYEPSTRAFLPNLVKLDVHSPKGNLAWLQSVCPYVTELSIANHTLSRDQLVNVARMPKLKFLSIRAENLPIEAALPLLANETLISIDVGDQRELAVKLTDCTF